MIYFVPSRCAPLRLLLRLHLGEGHSHGVDHRGRYDVLADNLGLTVTGPEVGTLAIEIVAYDDAVVHRLARCLIPQSAGFHEVLAKRFSGENMVAVHEVNAGVGAVIVPVAVVYIIEVATGQRAYNLGGE
jgi:hypothetical protein